MPFLIVQGDIAAMKTDAIVSSADTTLLSGGSVFERVHKAAGRGLKRACAALNGCAVGEAKITEACKLPCRYVIHTVGPVWHGGQNGEEELLASCYRNALRLAAEKGCSSLAFPLLSTGYNGYPKEQALCVAKDAIAAFLQERELDVYLVLFNRYMLQVDFLPGYSELHDFIVKSFLDTVDYLQCIADEYYYCKYNDKDISVLDGPLSWMYEKTYYYFHRNEAVADITDNRSFEQNHWSSDAFEQLPVLFRHVSHIEDDNGNPSQLWSQIVIRFINLKALHCEQCAVRANISSSYLQALCFDANVSPNKYTALAVAIALELSVDETREMLDALGFTWQRSDLFDTITEFYIAKGIYDIHLVNMALFAHGQRLLGPAERCRTDLFQIKTMNTLSRMLCGVIQRLGDGIVACVNKLPVSKIYNYESHKNNDDVIYSEDGTMLLRAGKRCSSVNVRCGVEAIECGAFNKCRDLTILTVPDGLISIGRYAFAQCTALETVSLPDSVTIIESGAFEECTSLNTIVLPDALTYIGYGVFKNCSTLKEVQIPPHIEIINDYAFAGCFGLETVNLPQGLLMIDDGAFKDCRSLKAVFLPDSVKAMGHSVFSNCTGLLSAKLPAHLNSISGNMFGSCWRLQEVILPDDLVEIGEGSFFNCNRLVAAVLPIGLKRIDSDAFWNCRKLESINFHSGIEVIGSSAFYNCQALRGIVILSGLNQVADRTFMNCCGITSVILSDRVERIGFCAFSDCISLVSVKIAESESAVVSKEPSEEQVFAYDECFATCKYARRFTGTCKTINNWAFWNCKNLLYVQLPSGITDISGCAFGNCESLRKINIPDTVTEIGRGAFFGCRNLEALVIPDSVRKIAADAFEGVPCVVYNGTAEGAPWGAGKVVAQL
ncbi:MAG: leucine-rich repeat protein [bacterium]|nr:leucine-rich repeat protein [bacterium]